MPTGVFTKVTPAIELSSNYFLHVLPQTQSDHYFSLMHILKVEPQVLQGEKYSCFSCETTLSYPCGGTILAFPKHIPLLIQEKPLELRPDRALSLR